MLYSLECIKLFKGVIMSDKLYNVLITEERADGNGEVRNFYHRVGTGFAHKDGQGMNLVIPEGISLSGRVLIRERTAKNDGEGNDISAASDFQN